MLKIGIPRALLFYEYYPFWRTFFKELNAEIVVSQVTTRDILDQGVRTCVDEACLPVKVFHGHIIDLKDRVDYLFIPRFTSIAEGEYVCPKFGGLPDMVRNSIEGLPPIISTEINFRESYHKVYSAISEIGAYFSSNKTKIQKAYKKAVQYYISSKEQFKRGVPGWMGQKNSELKLNNEFNHLNVGLLGHPYNIFDTYVNMNLIKKLNTSMVGVFTSEMMDEGIINKKAAGLQKKMFWTFGRRIIGAAMCMLERKDIQGIIYVMSFGCGLDSFICDMVERRARASGVPFSVLVLDEHTGEAGINTRIEAFIDMIKWRSKNENYISTYG